MIHTIGIIGVGMVGSTMKNYFDRKPSVDVLLLDPDQGYNDDVNKADVIFVCVPTETGNNGVFDLSILMEVLEKIEPGKNVVIRSTVIPGTTNILSSMYDLKLFYNPEFLTEATAQQNFDKPALQVVGCDEADQMQTAIDILEILPFSETNNITSWGTAEAIKMARNTLSASRVVVLNEIYNTLENAGINYEDNENFSVKDGLEALAKLPSMHLAVVHKGGRGAGGKCLRKDLQAFASVSESKLLKDIDEKNREILEQYPKE